MSIFSEIKQQLSMKDVARYYGLNISRSGFARCPFHNERTPSMKINLNEKEFESWKRNTYRLLTDYRLILSNWRIDCAPGTSDEILSDKYIESIQELEKTEYYCDLFLYGTRTDLEEFRQNEERLVKRIEQRVRNHKRNHMGKTSPIISA
jgi:hypothetical protein